MWNKGGLSQEMPESWQGLLIQARMVLKSMWIQSRNVGLTFEISEVMICSEMEQPICPFPVGGWFLDSPRYRCYWSQFVIDFLLFFTRLCAPWNLSKNCSRHVASSMLTFDLKASWDFTILLAQYQNHSKT